MKYLLCFMLFMGILSCDCESDRALVCDSGVTTFEGDPTLLDSIWMVVPNILLAEELAFNMVYIEHPHEIEDVKIESYSFEMSIEDHFFYETSNLDFISVTDRLTIPRDSLFDQIDIPIGYANFILRLQFIDREGFIGVSSGEVLLTDCATLLSGDVDVKDCRYSYDLIPSFEPLPFICM